MRQRQHNFQLLAAQAAHRLTGNPWFQLKQRLVDPPEILNIERAVVDPLAALATLGRRPEQIIEQAGHGALAPAHPVKGGHRSRAEERTERLNLQFTDMHALGEEPE